MADCVIQYRRWVVITFVLAALISAIAYLFVTVNYNMADYLPEAAPSIQALETMERQFASAVPNTRVMISEVSIQEALFYKEKLAAIDGVTEVLWLDDVYDLKTPLELAPEELVETYYKESEALFSISVRKGEEAPVIDAIYALIGDRGAVAGEALDIAVSQKMAGRESLHATALLVPIMIIILLISTSSWVEPLFFLLAIGVAIVINMGTNLFIGEISFITQSVAPILQLAVSLDYAIFLMHSFERYRKELGQPERAMVLAMKDSFPAIAASAATSFFGFMALMLMEYEIGADLGLNLMKGILISYLSVTLFLPALALSLYRWIEKTEHGSLVPQFKGLGCRILKWRIPILLLVLMLLVPSYLAQSQITFTNGLGEQPETSRAGQDSRAIQEVFGESTPMILLVPKGDLAREEQLVQDLEQIDQVTSLLAYVTAVGSAIPPEFLDNEVRDQFFSEEYSRIVLYLEMEKEGELPFSIVEQVKKLAREYYGEDALLLGESVTLYDINQTVTRDNTRVNLITLLTIGLVLLFTFRSFSFPVVLLLTIQAAVWINLSVPYFTGTSLIFVGYLIVSTVQLAATIDYAILLSDSYKRKRQERPALEAIKESIDEKTFATFISASILSSVGFILWLTSSNPIVASIGLLLGRGALLAFIMVLTLLPALLVVLDKLIRRTTVGSNFYQDQPEKEAR